MSSLGILKVLLRAGQRHRRRHRPDRRRLAHASRIMPPGITPPSISSATTPRRSGGAADISSERRSPNRSCSTTGLNFIRLRLFTIPASPPPAPFAASTGRSWWTCDPARVAAKGLSPNDVVAARCCRARPGPAGSARSAAPGTNVQAQPFPAPRRARVNDLPVKAVDGATSCHRPTWPAVRDGYAVQENVVRRSRRRATYLASSRRPTRRPWRCEGAREQNFPCVHGAARKANGAEIDFDQSVFVRAADRERPARSGPRLGPGSR